MKPVLESPIKPTLENEEHPQYSLESLEIDWNAVKAKEEERGRWSFTVPSREAGRKIGYEFVKAIGSEFFGKRPLEDPTPTDDIRLDGDQISFSEYNEDLEKDGPITVIEIYMRKFQQIDEYCQKFMKGINAILEKIKS